MKTPVTCEIKFVFSHSDKDRIFYVAFVRLRMGLGISLQLDHVHHTLIVMFNSVNRILALFKTKSRSFIQKVHTINYFSKTSKSEYLQRPLYLKGVLSQTAPKQISRKVPLMLLLSLQCFYR